MIAAYKHVDDPDVLDRIGSDPALSIALGSSRHPNWWGTGAGGELLIAARAEGLPLAWVPRRAIVRLLAAAATPGERAEILKNHPGEILTDCAAALDECTHPWIANDVVLARKALEAVKAGQHEAGMALAVCMGEPLAAWAATPRVQAFESDADHETWTRRRKNGSKYGWAQIEIERAGNDYERAANFQYQVLIAPLPRFFTPWTPESGKPRPSALSRHVVAHQAALDHFSPENALLSIMLISSILREQQDWSEQVEADSW